VADDLKSRKWKAGHWTCSLQQYSDPLNGHELISANVEHDQRKVDGKSK